MSQQMLKTACAIFVLMSFVGGLFAMLAFSFQKIDRIRKGRPRLFQKPSFRMLVVWMIMFGIFGAYYFNESRLFGDDLSAAYTWYGISMMLMPLAALMGSGLVRLSMSDKIKKIVTVYQQVEAKEKTKKPPPRARKKPRARANPARKKSTRITKRSRTRTKSSRTIPTSTGSARTRTRKSTSRITCNPVFRSARKCKPHRREADAVF